MNTQVLIDNLPFLIPMLVLQFGLMIFALIHILKHNTYRLGNRALWCVIVVLFSIIGPVAYLILGRANDGDEE
ncbi:MAG TPA: hypothetical protein DCW90_22150 [Lachnospiraceae bacterium]|nr:PLD nuclease N-terminal domain-containing protein [uncultured Lachnoclostridium sp.]HAU88076.1 hypothetical protein [Lachnospiraceae bacterium]